MSTLCENLLIFFASIIVFALGFFAGFTSGERSGVVKFNAVLKQELPRILEEQKCKEKCCISTKQ